MTAPMSPERRGEHYRKAGSVAFRNSGGPWHWRCTCGPVTSYGETVVEAELRHLLDVAAAENERLSTEIYERQCKDCGGSGYGTSMDGADYWTCTTCLGHGVEPVEVAITDEMVERAAESVHDDLNIVPWPDLSPRAQETWRGVLRAALTAALASARGDGTGVGGEGT